MGPLWLAAGASLGLASSRSKAHGAVALRVEGPLPCSSVSDVVESFYRQVARVPHWGPVPLPGALPVPSPPLGAHR